MKRAISWSVQLFILCLLSIIIIIIICSFSTIDSLPVDFFLLRLVGCTQPWGSATAPRATNFNVQLYF
jgi:hypothetical protein